MFVGVHCKNADYRKFINALEEEVKGTDNETIRQKTDWFKGMDNRWRFEIDDSKAKVIGLKDGDYYNADEGKRIGDFLKHDILFKAYPEIKEIGIEITLDNDENISPCGYFDPDRKIIMVTENTNERLKLALLHVIQYQIQEREGFATGAVPGSIKRAVKDELSKYPVKGIEAPKPLIMAQHELQDLNGRAESTVWWQQCHKLAAEVEARDTAIRSNLTTKERRKRPPDLPKDTIVIFQGKEHLYSKKDIFDIDSFVAERMLLAGYDRCEVKKTFSESSLINPKRDKVYAKRLVEDASKKPEIQEYFKKNKRIKR